MGARAHSLEVEAPFSIIPSVPSPRENATTSGVTALPRPRACVWCRVGVRVNAHETGGRCVGIT